MAEDYRLSRYEAVQEQLTALDSISTLLTDASFDLDSLLNEIVRITAQTLQMKACSLRLYDEETGEMVLKAVYGLSVEYQGKGPVMASKSIYQDMIQSHDSRGKVVEVFDVSKDPRVQYSKEAIAEGIHSMLAAPLVSKNTVIGALSVITMTPHKFTDDEIRIFKTIANQASAAIEIAQLHQNLLELKRIEQELDIARDIQARLMPSKEPDIPGLDIAGFNRPGSEVGGDFYDFIQLPKDNWGIALGDVSGKGIPAALLMATVRTSLRVQAENVYAMSEIITRVNKALIKDTTMEEFVTLFYAVFDTQEQVLTFINAGHNFPLLFRDDEILTLKTGGVPVGLFSDATYRQETMKVLPGDLLVIYSDGFTEAPGKRDEQYGEERLIKLIKKHRTDTPVEIVNALERSVLNFMLNPDESSDDRTLVIIKVPEKS